MTAVLVDSNVLLDVFTVDGQWFTWSTAALKAAGERSRLAINPVVYAEVAGGFLLIEELDAALPSAAFSREPIPYAAAFLAAKAFADYRRRGGSRRSPLPDFFIGAHAAVAGYRLLTRDAARYRSYFPRLPLIVPE